MQNWRSMPHNFCLIGDWWRQWKYEKLVLEIKAMQPNRITKPLILPPKSPSNKQKALV
jgi:hypothetical protein